MFSDESFLFAFFGGPSGKGFLASGNGFRSFPLLSGNGALASTGGAGVEFIPPGVGVLLSPVDLEASGRFTNFSLRLFVRSGDVSGSGEVMSSEAFRFLLTSNCRRAFLFATLNITIFDGLSFCECPAID